MLPTSLVTPLLAESCVAFSQAGTFALPRGRAVGAPRLSSTTFPNSIHTIVLREQQRKSVLCTLRRIVAKSIRHLAKVTLLALVLAAVHGLAQQPNAAVPDGAAQAPAQDAQQQLDLQDGDSS